MLKTEAETRALKKTGEIVGTKEAIEIIKVDLEKGGLVKLIIIIDPMYILHQGTP